MLGVGLEITSTILAHRRPSNDVAPTLDLFSTSLNATTGALSISFSNAGSDATLHVMADTTASYATAADAVAAIGAAADHATGAISSGAQNPTASLAGIAAGTYYLHFWATNTAGSSVVQSAGPYSVAIDTVPPTLVSAAGSVGGSTITVTFSKALAGATTTADWSLAGYTLTGASISGSTVVLTTSALLAAGSPALTYSGSGITNTAGYAVATFSTNATLASPELSPDPTFANVGKWSLPTGMAVSSGLTLSAPASFANAYSASPYFAVTPGQKIRVKLTCDTITTGGSFKLGLRFYTGSTSGYVSAVTGTLTLAVGDNYYDVTVPAGVAYAQFNWFTTTSGVAAHFSGNSAKVI